MHLILSICFGLIFSLVSWYSSAQTPEPPLNGIAIHSEFGKEQFIGAFYSSAPGDKADAFSNAQLMRMELKIVAPEGMTIRRFSRMWIEGMSINNDSALLTTQADNMVIFDDAFKGRFEQNDDIVFSYEQAKGVNLIVNKVLLANIDSEEFFNMLLRTWIGKVPLSTDYKNGMLKAGNVNADLKTRFDNIKPSVQRSLKIAEWIKTKPSTAIADTKKSSASALSQSSANEITKQAIATKTEATSGSSIKSEAVIPVAPESNSKTKKVTSSSVSQQEIQKTVAEDEKTNLTSQTLLVRQFYISELLKKIRSNTRYPSRANELGQNGSLRIALVIDREGNVLSTQFVQGSEYELLNKAALEAIKKSAPLPPMPDSLTGSIFEFSVPMNFVTSKTK